VLAPRRHEERLTADRVGLLERFDVRYRHLNLHWTFAVRRVVSWTVTHRSGDCGRSLRGVPRIADART
jgi:hypothetical protein